LKVFLVAKGEFFLFRYGDGTEFLLDHSGSKVWCRWNSEFSLDYASTYLYGPILGFLLRLRGVVCLHAGVAVIDDVAVGFVGPSGAGKSTLCAALAERGCPLISDDILALTERDGELYVIPTYPRVRLWPESARALFGSADALRPITTGWEKRHLDLSEDQFESEIRPLGAIYFLSDRCNAVSTDRIIPLNGARRLSSLLANVYAYRVFDEMREREFKVLSQVASRTPLRTVIPFDDLGQIGELCRLIRDDLGTLLPLQVATTGGADLHV
jgi:hypothetical protein